MLLGLSTAAVLLGASWILVTFLLWNGVGAMPVLMICGLVLLGLGTLGLLANAVMQMRDPVTFVCPACAKPVSRWRFVGVYARSKREADPDGDVDWRRRSAAALAFQRKSVDGADTCDVTVPLNPDHHQPENVELEQGAMVKYHMRHALCVHCKQKVVEDRWDACTEQRLYHSKCWRQQCEQLLASDTAIVV